MKALIAIVTERTFGMRRFAALLALVLTFAGLAGFAANDAKALYPSEQTSVTNVVNIVYADLVEFWIPRTNPTVAYYNNGHADYWAQCSPAAWTGNYRGAEGFECNGHIYLDYYQQVANLRAYGDGAVALWLAHEFGHHIEELLEIDWRSYAPYHELLADCFAGMYFRHGVVNANGALNYNDYRYDARNQIWALNYSPSHGTREQRLRAFDFGYTQTTYRGCINAAGISY
jgi:predicted metalloprotease